MGAVGKEPGQRKVHRRRNSGLRIQRGNGVPILHPLQITAQQTGALFNVTLRHAFLQAEIADRLADVHEGFSSCEGVAMGLTA